MRPRWFAARQRKLFKKGLNWREKSLFRASFYLFFNLEDKTVSPKQFSVHNVRAAAKGKLKRNGREATGRLREGCTLEPYIGAVDCTAPRLINAASKKWRRQEACLVESIASCAVRLLTVQPGCWALPQSPSLTNTHLSGISAYMLPHI